MQEVTQIEVKQEIRSASLRDYPYYCYVLIDPRNEKIFYVGKGQKNRAFQEEKLYWNVVRGINNIIYLANYGTK